MNKQVTYFTGEREIRLDVLATNADGTLDLGIADKDKEPVLKVGKCPISTSLKSGHCVQDDGKAPKDADDDHPAKKSHK